MYRQRALSFPDMLKRRSIAPASLRPSSIMQSVRYPTVSHRRRERKKNLSHRASSSEPCVNHLLGRFLLENIQRNVPTTLLTNSAYKLKRVFTLKDGLCSSKRQQNPRVSFYCFHLIRCSKTLNILHYRFAAGQSFHF